MPKTKHARDINKRQPLDKIGKNDETEDGESGRGGITGEVEFRYRDPMAGPVRDDFLSPKEIQHLLVVHKDIHKDRVEKQKIKRQARAAEDARPTSSLEKKYAQGGQGLGQSSAYKTHPISQKVQFSGMRDAEVVGVANLNTADTNSELKEKLENRNENKLRNTPKFNPKPRYPGS